MQNYSVLNLWLPAMADMSFLLVGLGEEQSSSAIGTTHCREAGCFTVSSLGEGGLRGVEHCPSASVSVCCLETGVL